MKRHVSLFARKSNLKEISLNIGVIASQTLTWVSMSLRKLVVHWNLK